MFLKMYLNSFLRRVILIKGYKNCMESKTRNKQFPYLNNSGLDQTYFINTLNLLYTETWSSENLSFSGINCYNFFKVENSLHI